jgi:N-acetylneuraminic acid mutarotase
VFDPAINQWAWMGGGTGGGLPGVYGTRGAPAGTNMPGARSNAISEVDAQGNLWLFGGWGRDAGGARAQLNDVWKYDVSLNQWTWMGGGREGVTAGSLALQVPAAVDSVPGARESAASWQDGEGHLWMFGGLQSDASGKSLYQNDLWRFDPAANQWDEIGAEGLAGSPNLPRGRAGSAHWVDGSHLLWLFGGECLDGHGTIGYLNDLWMYDAPARQWTRMGGSHSVGKQGWYGKAGSADPDNVPGARSGAASWTDSRDRFWLFGGYGYDAKGVQGNLSDLWMFDASLKEWTWMGGSNTALSAADSVTGTMDSVPGHRAVSANWTGKNGLLWLFGGQSSLPNHQVNLLTDLWAYDPQPQDSGTAAPPTFSPAGGGYPTAQPVTLSDTTPGAVIHYTLNSSTPTAGSPVYSSPLSISKNTLVGAIAVATGYTTSPVASASYTIRSAAPTISPAAGGYPTAQPVTLSDTTPGAKIYYTMDGTWPATSSTLYATPIILTKNTTIRAMAQAPGYGPSIAASATYSIRSAAPTISPAGGGYPTAQPVTLSDTTPGAKIYYTMDGTWPTISSTLYATPIILTKNTTIRAMAQAPGYGPSVAAFATYTIRSATPTLSPSAGDYTSPQSVTLSDTTPGANIYYTLDGTWPTISSAVYTGPISVSKATMINTFAQAPGYGPSTSASAIYYFRPAEPVITPAAGTYSTAQSVVITDSTPGAIIYYTVDGTTPNPSSPTYTDNFPFYSNMTVKAVANKPGLQLSTVATAVYTVISPEPTFYPPPGSYIGPRYVTISDALPRAQFFYTLDGTAPTTSSSLYTEAVLLTGDTTLKAIAVGPGYGASAIAVGQYSMSPPRNPTVTLKLTAAGSAVASVTSGTVVTLTATVKVGSTAVTSGKVNFCDATVPHCTDIHILGSAQLTSAGTAVVKLRPRLGTNSIKAVFEGKWSYATGTSAPSSLNVTGTTTTSLAQSGTAGNFTLSATVAASGSRTAPTGSVTFVDATNGNAVLGSASLGADTAAQTFAEQNTFPAGFPQIHVYDLALGDLNGDGILDFVAPKDSVSISVLTGKADGTFNAMTSFEAGRWPVQPGIWDFNGDGIPDLAVPADVCPASGGQCSPPIINMFPGKGDGTFNAPVGSELGGEAEQIAIGDFNGDGIQDIATASRTSVGGAVLLGKGDGTFGNPVHYPEGTLLAINIASGDFNNDGFPDLVLTWDGLGVLINKRDGTFSPEVRYATAGTGGTPAIADVNRDGILDIVTAGSQGSVGVLIGKGDGTFKQQVTYPAGSGAAFVVVEDFNGDGVPDLAVGTGEGVMVLVGKGDGTFGAPTAYLANTGLSIAAAGDFNGDGVPDLVTYGLNDSGYYQLRNILFNQLTTTATATLSGVSVPSGHLVKAVYAGDSIYAGSSSSTTPLGAITATPIFNPSAGTYSGTPSVTISDSTPGASIYYTLDGTVPTSSSTVYSGPITILKNTTIRAMAMRSDYFQSTVSSATYLIVTPAPPTFDPDGGTYSTNQSVIVTMNNTLSAQIYYTLDNSTPTTSSTPYSGPITISSNTTLKAIAVAAGYQPSSVTSAAYTFRPPSATTAALSVTTGTTDVTSVTNGTVITLTAAVKSGSTVVTRGLVNFCDAAAPYCTDTHILGSAQLTSAGTAVVKLRPHVGANNIKAMFAGTWLYNPSTSVASTLGVTGGPTSTVITYAYADQRFLGDVTGWGSRTAPTGRVSFVDTSDANAILGSASLATGAVKQSFAPPTVSYPAGQLGESLASGDFNGDGIPDLVVVNMDVAHSVNVLLGKADGTLGAAVVYPIGHYAQNVVIGDFNGDEIPDLAIATTGDGGGDGAATVLLGIGDGAFGAPTDYETGQGTWCIAVGDVNRDGIPDLVVTSFYNVVNVLLGKGDGTFKERVSYPTGAGTVHVAIGDLDRDGIPDLVVTNYEDGTVGALLGKGDGRFHEQVVVYTVGGHPAFVALGDFNGDGILDIASDKGRVFMGKGDGTFNAPIACAAIGGTGQLVVGDFNGDGIPDIAVDRGVVLGKGDGTFGALFTYSANIGMVVAGDFNGDGIPDLATVVTNDFGVASANVLLNQLTTKATATLSGVSVPSGHLVKATYPGDSLYAPSSSSTIPLALGAAQLGVPPPGGATAVPSHNQ